MIRRGLGVLLPIVVLMTLLSTPPASAETVADKAGSSLDSATWHWAETTPNGDPFRRLAPLIEVTLGPAGSSVWAGNWTLGEDAGGPLAVRFTGLPRAVTVAPAGFPLSVAKDHRAPVTACQSDSEGVTCALRRPKGSEGTTAVVLRGGRKLTPGRHAVTATLLRGGAPVSGGDEQFFLLARTKTPDEFFVTREGGALVTAGQPALHKVAAYRLSGTKRGADLRVKDLVPPRLKGGVRVKGRGWQCNSGDCTLQRQVTIGQRAPALGMLWLLRNSDVRKWPRIEGAKAHRAAWWSRYSGGRFRQDTSLVPMKQATNKKPKTAKQLLAPSRRAMVTAQVQQLGPARIGGDGRYQVRLGNGGSRAATAVRVALKPPAHARITKIKHAKRWRCAAASCRWQGKLKPKKTVPPVTVLLRSKGRKASQAPFVAVASWQGKGSRRVTNRTVERSPWLAPLRVSASTTNKMVHSASGIKTQLMAQLRATEGTQVHYRWRQLSGPKVTWVGPQSGSVSDVNAGARFTPPRVSKPRTLKFQVTASGGGATVRDTVKVAVKPAGERADWDPRTNTTVPPSAAEAEQRLNHKPRPLTPRGNKAVAWARVNKPGVSMVRPGQRVTLNLRKLRLGRGVKLRDVVWRMDGKVVKGKRGSKITGRIKKNAVKPINVTARMRLDKGRFVDVGEILVIQRKAKPRVKSKAPRGGVRAASAITPSSLCDAFDIAVNDTVTIGGLTLTASAVDTTGTCSGSTGSMTLTAAPFQVDGATVTGLTLTMTSTGITASVTSIALPGADAVDVSGTLTATWTGSFSGSVTATGAFPFLSLPDGWSASSFTVTFGGGDLSVAATATGPSEGQATITGDLNTDGSFSLDVAVQNAISVTGLNGSQAMFNGSGSIARSSTGTMTYDVDLGMSTSSLELLNNVSLGSASLDWSNTGLTLSGSVTATIGSESVDFTVSADITDATDWTATITTTATPTVGTLPLASLSGTFTYNKTLTFDIAASVSNVDVSSFLGLDITTASASITNDSTDLQLSLAIAGSVELFSDTIDVSTTVNVDITTGKFDADFSLGGSGFGPSEAQLTAVNFFVANDGASDPALAGNVCLPPNTTGTVYGFTATATIMSDVSFQVTGVYQDGDASNPSGSGYCFTGTLASSAVSELNGTGVADTLNFVYSTYATTADNQAIPATSPTMWATMALPSQVQTYLNNDVTGFTVLIELIETNGTFSGLTIDGIVDMSAYVAGSATDLPSFELVSIGVDFEVSVGDSDSVEISFDCDGVLTTPGNGAGSMTQQTMDFDASIGLQFGSSNGGGSLNLTANIEGDEPVTNMFGVTGLTIQQMGIAAVIGFDALLNSSLTISATNVELPGTIAGPIGLSSTAPIDFSLTVGIVAPCFLLSIGTPDQTTNAAIDWGGAGVLEAYYFKLLLAPFGNCTESDGTQITGNFGVDFDGYIFGVEVDINGMVEIDPEFSADIDATVGGFNLAGLDMQQTVIDLDFAPSQGVFDLNFSGGVNLWSTIIVQVSGTVDVDLSATQSSIDIQFDGSMEENLFGIFTSEVWVDLDVDAGINSGTFYLNTLDVSIGGDVKILVFESAASFTLDYSDGGVQTLTGSFSVNMNLWIVDFGVELAFQYDPAVTGNQDLAISITGYMDIDLWLFSIDVSVTISIDVDASFLGGSEYHPQPPQQVSAPMSLVSANQNTNPNSWNWNSAMYQGNNFGWMANLFSYQDAIADAVGVPGWEGGYYPSIYAGQTPNVGDVEWIMDQMWPGSYTANQASSAFAVVPTNGSATVGETTSSLDTYSQLEVTATLPPSPMAKWWSSAVYTAQAQGLSDTYLPSESCMTQNTTATWEVQIPEVPNPSPENWAWVILDTNWRLFGATMREVNETSNGFVNVEAFDSIKNYSWYDAPVPMPILESQVASGFTFDCGYGDFTGQTSLYDFMSQQSIPWESLPPSFLSDNGYTEASTNNLSPGWKSGWDPYDLTNVEFTSKQAFDVSVSSGTTSCTIGDPVGPAEITATTNVGSIPTDVAGVVEIPQGGYVQLEAVSDEVFNLNAFNASGQQVQWSGTEWVQGTDSLTYEGYLLNASHEGVLFQSGRNSDEVIYLAFSADNAIQDQIDDGVTSPTYTYLPALTLNGTNSGLCGDGTVNYSDPNAVQGQAPSTPPSWPSLSTFTFGSEQVATVTTPGTLPQCPGDGLMNPFTVSMAQGPVTGTAGPPVDLAATGWTLQLQMSGAVGSLALYNQANQEVRWYDTGWITQPSGGWPSGTQSFAGDIYVSEGTLYGASTTGVMYSYGSTAVYLWFAINNPMATNGSGPFSYTYTPDQTLNGCPAGNSVYQED